MKTNVLDTNSEFSKTLLQKFLGLRRQSESGDDTAGVETLDVIIGGIMELARAMADDHAGARQKTRFTTNDYSVFLSLAKSPNDALLLKRTGVHYLVEWHLPQVALSHFQRALSLNGSDATLPMLIETASRSVRRKNEIDRLFDKPGMGVFSEGQGVGEGK